MICFYAQPAARAFLAGSEGSAGLPRALPVLFLSSGCQDSCLLFFLNLLHFPPLSLLCPSHRAITGVYASTTSICQHDHVSEEGTLRRHGFRCGRTRRHHCSQWWRGGVCAYSWTHRHLCFDFVLPLIILIYMCASLRDLFTPTNLSSSIWHFFCSIKSLIVRPF